MIKKFNQFSGQLNEIRLGIYTGYQIFLPNHPLFKCMLYYNNEYKYFEELKGTATKIEEEYAKELGIKILNYPLDKLMRVNSFVIT